jgi:hypothetical protein
MGQSTSKPVKTAEELRREIEQTRANMTETVGAIETQLPQTIKAKAEETMSDVKEIAQTKLGEVKEMAVNEYQTAKAAVKHEVTEQVREAKYAVRRATVGRVENMVHRASDSVSDAGSTIVDTIRENPIPAALIGIGLAWMFMGGSSRRDSQRTMRTASRRRYLDEPRYGEFVEYEDDEASLLDRGRDAVTGGVRRARGAVNEGLHGAAAMAHDASDRVQEFAGHTTDRARGLAIRAEREAEHLGREAMIRARRAERGAERMYEENPLAVGAAAIAVGAMVGLALPRTEREDELMGSARDRLIQQAEELATNAVDKASDVAKDKLGKLDGNRASIPS